MTKEVHILPDYCSHHGLAKILFDKFSLEEEEEFLSKTIIDLPSLEAFCPSYEMDVFLTVCLKLNEIQLS